MGSAKSTLWSGSGLAVFQGVKHAEDGHAARLQVIDDDIARPAERNDHLADARRPGEHTAISVSIE